MSKAEKIIVKLIEKNQQLEEDAERYQKLFLEMEQKVWNLENELKREQQRSRELDAINTQLYDEEPLSMTDEEVRRRLAEPIAYLTDKEPLGTVLPDDPDLDDWDDTLTPEQDCGD